MQSLQNSGTEKKDGMIMLRSILEEFQSSKLDIGNKGIGKTKDHLKLSGLEDGRMLIPKAEMGSFESV